MKTIKLLATLSVGIFFGYILATMTAIDVHEERNITIANHTSALSSEENLAKKTSTDYATTITQPTEVITEELNSTAPDAIPAENSIDQTLEQNYQQLTKALQASESKIVSLKRKLAKFDNSAISTVQMEDLVEAPFKDLVTNFTGADRDKIYNFHQAEDDLDWGYNMQNYISDFILTHYNINDISLVSVICKHQMCELLVIQHLDGSWDKIAQDLRQQPWWKFSSTSSLAGNSPDSENSLAIYTFLSI